MTTTKGDETRDRIVDRALRLASKDGLAGLSIGRLATDLARYAGEAELIVLPAANRHHIQPTDFDHASRLIGEAAADARRTLDALAGVEAAAA